MEPIQIQNLSDTQLTQDRIVKQIIRLGHTIFGDYVLKTMVNGDATSTIDVTIPSASFEYGTSDGNSKGVNELADNLIETFGCECFDAGHLGYSDTYSVHLSCPTRHMKGKSDGEIIVNILDDIPWTSLSPYDNLRSKEVNGKPAIVTSDGDNEKCKKIVTDLRRKKFTSWPGMTSDDKWYFNMFKWTDTNSLTYKVKKHFGFEE